MNELETSGGAGELLPAAASDPEFLHALFDSIPCRAVVLDRDAVFRYANREFLDFAGQAGDTVIGRSLGEVLGEAVAQSYATLMERLLAGERVRREGWADYGPRGRRYVQETLTPWRHGGGPVAGVIAIVRDMTDLKANEAALQATEAYNAAIVSTALDGIVVIGDEGTVVDYNPAAEAIFGYPKAEVIGRSISDLIIPPEFRAAHAEGMKRYLTTGESRILGRRLQLEALRADSRRIPIELAITDVTRNGKPLFAAHMRDLTSEREASAEIERQREALYQKEKLAALGSLLAGVAHELNNPLAIVLGQATLLREILEEDDPATLDAAALAERCAKIENAANRCGRIVKSFLAMARQRKGEHQRVDIPELLADVVNLVGYNLRSSGVEVETEIAPALPVLIADRDQLHQVIVNLVVNAHQALDEKGGTDRRIRLKAACVTGGDAIEISVSDNGPGIPPAIRSRIFEPFFSTKPQGYGTGIGLAISRGLVETHGGTLELGEGEAPGATFLIRLPIAGIGENVGEPAPAKAARGKAPAPSRGTVLVVDDEKDIVELLTDMLRQLDFEVVSTQSGKAAIAMLGAMTAPPDAIICDIRMPDGDGPFFYGWLEANHPELLSRIVFLTGDSLGPSASRFLARSKSPSLEKPFSRADIATMLEDMMGRSRIG
ncbi:PAS domain S-box protein [Bosea sp. F3-2]|nr:PAS domain S-box protein [Bosea sp. F3-2]